MRKLLFLLALIVSAYSIQAQGYPNVEAVRIDQQIQIDGQLGEAAWASAPIATNFTQNDPQEGAPPSQKTEVKFLYDNEAIYVGAICYDTEPDKILAQLGNRDDDLNADLFKVGFDTYNKGNDAFFFEITASGVQSDWKWTDESFNAVWNSAVQITDIGWVVEFKIPYSAVRFPNTTVQNWGLQITRTIRRVREFDQWSLEPKDASNPLSYYGQLNGIRDIDAPIRLAFIPYLTVGLEHYPYDIESESNFSPGFSGGMDMKYGINESFTLDMTLLPDFSQVQSDNLIKNVTAFETEYDDYRPFFQEGVDLFNWGDLFYSRRIGGTPYDIGNAFAQQQENEVLTELPGSANLLNATKVSGRTPSGFGVGVLNAIHGKTYATLQDTLTGEERKVLIEPFTNFNMLSLHQDMGNGSSLFFTNANTYRAGDYRDANVTSIGINQLTANGKWNYGMEAAMSTINQQETKQTTSGYEYWAGFGKASGNFQFDVSTYGISPEYDKGDMGIQFATNYREHYGSVEYNIYNPFGPFLNLFTISELTTQQNFSTGELSKANIRWEANTTWLKKYFTMWAGTEHDLINEIDYFEPRVAGLKFQRPRQDRVFFGLSSDYRKTLAVDYFNSVYYSKQYDGLLDLYFRINPILRVNDHLQMDHVFVYSYNREVGFADLQDAETPIFGRRDRIFYTNVFTGRYLFKNNLSLSLRARHYWSYGKYSQFYKLNEDGTLGETSDYNGKADFNFNAFNIDLVFNWEFAPGSNLQLIYKNAITEDSDSPQPDFISNFGYTLDQPQLNSLTLKVLYYLDWVYLQKKNS